MKKLNLDEIKEMLGEIGPALEESWDEIKEHFQKSLMEFRKKISVTSVDNVTMYEIDTLTSSEMLKHAKAHIVKGANMVAAYKQEGIVKDNNICLIHLAYGKGRELLPDNENHYIIIKANKLDKDVRNLFNESELVILK